MIPEKTIRFVLADPGAILPRRHDLGPEQDETEPLHVWQTRAVMTLLENWTREHADLTAEIDRLHEKFAPLACIYDDGDEAKGGDPCIWCDREKPVVTFQPITGTTPTYAQAYAVACPECGAPVRHRCANDIGKARTEPHKARRELGKART